MDIYPERRVAFSGSEFSQSQMEAAAQNPETALAPAKGTQPSNSETCLRGEYMTTRQN